jgi:Transposase DDE domain
VRDSEVMGRIGALIADFGRGMSKPELKFLNRLIFGILCSQSSLLSEIARATAPRKKVKAVWKRLDINLGKYDLNPAYRRAQARMLRQVDETFLFIFDPSEVVKPFAEKMEGLALVRDASEKPRLVKDPKTGKMKEVPVLKPGYPLRVSIALSPHGNILPIELSLYSAASETFVSENDEYIQTLDTLIQQTRFAPILVLDREFDAFIIIRHLCQLRQRFIIRVTSNRKYKLVDATTNTWEPTYTREEMAQKHAFLESKAVVTYYKSGAPETNLFLFKAARVQLLAERKNEHSIREGGEHDALTLIEMKIQSGTGWPTLYLLTNIKLNTPDELEKTGRAYLARWNIEEYIRFLKQHYSLEGFLVRDLGRMKNLISAVYIATVILHLLTDRSSLQGWRTHDFLVENALEVAPPKKHRDFFLYAYGRGVKYIVQANQSLLKPLNARQSQSDEIPENQLSLPIT